MIYVIALRQAARTGDRWQVLPRAYYSKSYRTSIDGSAHAAGVMPARREKPTAPRRGLFSAQ